MKSGEKARGQGRSWGGPGRSWAGPGEFLEDFGGSGGPKKKVAFPGSKSNETFRKSKNRNFIVI